METQRHVSLQIFFKHFFLLPSITITCPVDSLYSCDHCIPMSHESSLESSCPNVQLIHTYTLYTLPCFDICFLAYSYKHAVMLALSHGISRLLAHIFFTSNGMFRILHIVSKRSKSFRQPNFYNCSRVGASCLLFSLT